MRYLENPKIFGNNILSKNTMVTEIKNYFELQDNEMLIKICEIQLKKRLEGYL